MLSSTSSSKVTGLPGGGPRRPRGGRGGARGKRFGRRAPALALLAAGTCAALTALAAAAWAFTPLAATRLAVADVAVPPAAEFYLASYKTSIDHSVIYHGLSDTPPGLTAADALILGNSRLLHALPQDVMRPLFGRHGYRPYLLGFDDSEHDRFAGDLIRKYDLHPRLVVVNADRFFIDAYSRTARRVVAESRFDAAKNFFELNASFRAQRLLRQAVPHWADVLSGRWLPVVFRSRVDGAWSLDPFPNDGAPVPDEPGAGPPVPERQVEIARRFHAEVTRRGGRLVLTYVPNPFNERRWAEQVAARLGVPLIAPRPPGLCTYDGSHLDHDSMYRFARAFAAELDRELAAGADRGGRK